MFKMHGKKHAGSQFLQVFCLFLSSTENQFFKNIFNLLGIPSDCQNSLGPDRGSTVCHQRTTKVITSRYLELKQTLA